MVKPTVIGTKSGQPSPVERTESKLKPTAIKPTVKPATASEPAKTVKPTGIAVKDRPAPVPQKPSRPSAIPGRVVKTVDVTYEDLEKKFPTAEPKVIEAARTILCGIVLDSLDAASALSLGCSIQEKYSQLVDTWLALTNKGNATTALRHVARLKSILQEILDELDDTSSWGGIKSLFKKETLKSRFDKAQPEISQLRSLLRSSDVQLTSEINNLKLMRKNAQSLLVQSKAFALACEYLCDLVGSDLKSIVVDRGLAVSRTATMIVSQDSKFESDEKAVIALIGSIQEVVATEITALITLVASSKENDTQRFVIRDKMSDIIRKLT